ncbi:MAG TPA: hypothetical protein VL400_05635, partial [Polyangiaceae bacterium]|nr:hypothetical protein [Polyangiaceae bacterium]
EPALVDALRARSVDVAVPAWDDDAVDWSAFDVAVIRSTWNYVPRRDDFVAWAERASGATRLFNPPDVLRDNSDKIYLRDLAAQGVPVVPTTFVDMGASAEEVVAGARAAGLRDVVVKPRVSAGSFFTERFDLERDAARATRFLADRLTERPMMLQPYQDTIATSGERSLCFVDGEITHHVRKSPRFSGEAVVVSDALPLEADLVHLADRVLAPVRERILYGRVDMLRDEAGMPRIMEVELIEPYLVFGKAPSALERLADAMIREATRR